MGALPRCWHCGRLPTLVGQEQDTGVFYWCSTELRDPQTGDVLGCGASGPVSGDEVSARTGWTAYVAEMKETMQ